MKISPPSSTPPIAPTSGPKIDGPGNTNGTNTPKVTDGAVEPAPTPKPTIGSAPQTITGGQFTLDSIAKAVSDVSAKKR